MKLLIILITVFFSVSCSSETEVSESVSTKAEPDSQTPETQNTEVQENASKRMAGEAPNLTDYEGICPKAWGIVNGASRAHVDKFIQNYFHVPENPSAMYSDINTFAQPDGSTLLKAGTYKMQDSIVDQEMVATFVAGKMTQCGFRLRCSGNTDVWVSSCD